MQRNIGSLDRMVRLVLGLAGILGGFFYWHNWIIGIVSIVLLATSLTNFCPIYAMIGMRTNKGSGA